MEQKKQVTVNKEQELYVIPSGKGFSCLGFDVAINKIKALSKELNIPCDNLLRGSIETYNIYLKVLEIAYSRYEANGWRSKSELYEPFIGHEGKRVEVEYFGGEKERFYIGKSTGFVPCHLIIKQSNSTGGVSLCKNLIKSYRFIS